MLLFPCIAIAIAAVAVAVAVAIAVAFAVAVAPSSPLFLRSPPLFLTPPRPTPTAAEFNEDLTYRFVRRCISNYP